MNRVACQTCHIPTYAKNAADTPATEATETHRTWKTSDASAPPYHPSGVKANNLTPQYRFWNRYSTNYRLGDVAQKDAEAAVCSQCHDPETNPGFTGVHRQHVTDKRFGCLNCHTFSRPERNLN